MHTFVDCVALLLAQLVLPIIIVNPELVVSDFYLLHSLLGRGLDHEDVLIGLVFGVHTPEIDSVGSCGHCETLPHLYALDGVVFL